MELAVTLGWFWYHLGQLDAGRRTLERVLSLLPETSTSLVRARALTAAARLACYLNDFEPARAMADQAIDLAVEHGNDRDLAYALYVRALAGQGVGDPAAVGFAHDAVSHMRMTTDEWGLGLTLFYLGTVAIFVGTPDVISPALAESEVIFRRLGDTWGVGGALFYRGVVSRRDGAPAHARGLVEESVQMFRSTADRWRLMVALGTLAELTEEMGEESEALHVEVAALRRQLGLAAG